ncbi:MAG: hypothetical protein MMC33_005584 [Icmadophila ericetorum]|nr:hypothetical protein [Icmadophila ericetorum]
MGQSNSTTQRDRNEFSRRDSRRFSQLVRDREALPVAYGSLQNTQSEPAEESPLPSGTRSIHRVSHSIQPLATLRRHIASQSLPLRGGQGGTTRSSNTHNEVLYEQEERLLLNVEDMLRMPEPDTPITNITASPMPRRQSVISRLSRFLPRHTPEISSANTNGPEMEQRSTLRRRLSDSAARRATTPEGRNRHRFSMLGSLSPSSTSNPPPPRQLAPISNPIPIVADGTLPSSGLTAPSLHPPNSDQAFSFGRAGSFANTSTASQGRSRLARVRRSISTPIENIFSSNTNQTSQDRQTQTPPRRPSRGAIADETDYLLPPLNVADTNIEVEEPILGNFESGEHRHAEVFSPVAESPEPAPAWTQRWADRTPNVRRESRRVPSLLRGRSSRLIRRDDEAPLSRILQLAAAAIAAQLSGTPEAITDMEAIGDEGLDGSLNNFMETLNNAAGTSGTNDANRTLTTLPPLNFLRVFRFVNTSSDRRRPPGMSRQDSTRNSPSNESDMEDGNDSRTVTLVVVGVRSVPSASINRDGLEGGEPSLDTLLSLPLVPSPTPLRSGGFLRHANGRSRFTPRRRASIGGVNPFPANYDSQRHQRMRSSSRPGSGHSTPINTTPVPMVLSESPPGPHPPPSTPAEPGLSAQTSGTTTPNRRPSSASAAHLSPTPHQDITSDRTPEANANLAVELDATQTVRQRRRSDSEFARHRDLGAGAARRNGVVEPDNAPSQGRSWLIYVVGTNLSEDHPAFATPSLFTDNPTYEDMLLLSSLLGPAKPPVASSEDVASMNGVFRIERRGNSLIAVAIDGSAEVQIAQGERCLVCLDEYESEEEVRQLSNCAHVFHRICIDHWLTTGRNSCPLCRGKGVNEKAANREPTPAMGESL